MTMCIVRSVLISMYYIVWYIFFIIYYYQLSVLIMHNAFIYMYDMGLVVYSTVMLMSYSHSEHAVPRHWQQHGVTPSEPPAA
jgi:hypothetical protein